ncbi:MAG: hypothetical protein K6G58_05815 [Lachnospiraceae bacterium]|nr:hypothetical protein [Lachnospiraceae bacterium]
MSKSETFSAVLSLFTRYYNINTDSAEPPFAAEAVFQSHNEQYYLIKAAKVADINMNEYVYFAECDSLSAEKLRMLDETAWERGSAKAVPGFSHRSTDVTLMIVADSVDDDAKKLVRKMRHYKSYKFGMHGWSNYRLAVIECMTGRAFYNHQGRSLKKLVSNIL